MIQVVQVNSTTYPPYVGAGTVTQDTVTTRAATVQLASPSSANSEVAFLYLDDDLPGHDPGWATPGISTFSGSWVHDAGSNGMGSIVAYAPNALASATTSTLHNSAPSYVAIAFELIP